MHISALNPQDAKYVQLSAMQKTMPSADKTVISTEFSAIFQPSKAPPQISVPGPDTLIEPGKISPAATDASSDKAKVAKAFEAMVVAQFLGSLFTGSSQSFFGDGVQGDFAKTMLSDAIARSITERGGLGIGKTL